VEVAVDGGSDLSAPRAPAIWWSERSRGHSFSGGLCKGPRAVTRSEEGRSNDRVFIDERLSAAEANRDKTNRDRHR
jgi:hypothetical protein